MVRKRINKLLSELKKKKKVHSRGEITNMLHDLTGVPKNIIADIISAYLNAVKVFLLNGDAVKLDHLGYLIPMRRKGRYNLTSQFRNTNITEKAFTYTPDMEYIKFFPFFHIEREMKINSIKRLSKQDDFIIPSPPEGTEMVIIKFSYLIPEDKIPDDIKKILRKYKYKINDKEEHDIEEEE